jgi:hypothetical protein
MVFVSHASFASNLVAADPNGTLSDVFVDCGAGPVLVSVSAAGDLGDSYTPFISGNNRYIAFASRAYSFDAIEVAGDYDADIFVYDRVLATISRVSVNFFGGEALNGDSYSPSISRDGRIITFASEANNLDVHLPDLNARRDIFVTTAPWHYLVYDFGLTQRISLSFNQGEPNDWSFAGYLARRRSCGLVSSDEPGYQRYQQRTGRIRLQQPAEHPNFPDHSWQYPGQHRWDCLGASDLRWEWNGDRYNHLLDRLRPELSAIQSRPSGPDRFQPAWQFCHQLDVHPWGFEW